MGRSLLGLRWRADQEEESWGLFTEGDPLYRFFLLVFGTHYYIHRPSTDSTPSRHPSEVLRVDRLSGSQRRAEPGWKRWILHPCDRPRSRLISPVLYTVHPVPHRQFPGLSSRYSEEGAGVGSWRGGEWKETYPQPWNMGKKYYGNLWPIESGPSLYFASPPAPSGVSWLGSLEMSCLLSK